MHIHYVQFSEFFSQLETTNTIISDWRKPWSSKDPCTSLEGQLKLDSEETWDEFTAQPCDYVVFIKNSMKES